MSIDITTLLSQKPNFIGINEPVCGSSDPANQEVTVLPDGTIVNGIEGVDNRATGHLWGLFKLMSQIFLNGHEEDGSHNLTASDISLTAAITESQLALDFIGQPRPSGGTYNSTQDIIDEIALWYPYYQISSTLSAVRTAIRTKSSSCKQNPVGWVNPVNTYSGTVDSNISVANNDTFFFSTWGIQLTSSNNPTGTECLMPVLPASKNLADDNTNNIVVWLEIWEHNVTDTGVAFPFGNTEYKNTDNAPGTNGILYDHSDQTISTVDPLFTQFVADPKNNVDLDENGKVIQMVYKIRQQNIEYELFKKGLDSPAIHSFLTNQPVVKSTDYKGIWESSDKTTKLIPICLEIRRNAGIFHETINPSGTAVTRSTESLPISFSQCFEQFRVGYFSDVGVECSNYVTASYDSVSDTYELSSVTYYRSGLTITTISGQFNEYYADQVYENDVFSYKAKCVVDPVLLSEESINKLFAGKLLTELIPTYYGTVSSEHTSKIWNKNPVQIVGFGSSESDVFGTNNVGAVFIDKDNNGDSCLVDECKRSWVDEPVTTPTSFSFREDQHNSESKPALLTYESTSKTVSLNSTGLSGIPLIMSGTDVPTMYWENGEIVQLGTTWTGSNTTSMSCVIDVTDASNHAGMFVYGLCDLCYKAGGGTPFVIKDILKISDRTDTDYPFMYTTSDDFTSVETFTKIDTAHTGSTTTTIILDSGSSATNDIYVGETLVFIKSAASIPIGTSRQIVSYDGTTKVVTLDSPLPDTPIGGDLITISVLTTSTLPTIIIDSYARGVRDSYRRSTFLANTSGVAVVDKAIVASSLGTIYGGIVTGLVPGEAVDVIFHEEFPFNDVLRIVFKNTGLSHQYHELPSTGIAKIVNSGKAFVSNVGSGNDGDATYMGVLPNFDFPNTDGVKWVGVSPEADFVNLIVDLAEIGWIDILPWAGQEFNYSDRTLNEDIDGKVCQLLSTATVVDPNSGVIVAVLLIVDEIGYKLLVSTTHQGQVDFSDLTKTSIVDLSSNYGCSI